LQGRRRSPADLRCLIEKNDLDLVYRAKERATVRVYPVLLFWIDHSGFIPDFSGFLFVFSS
jgi:hypothetical protein